MNTLKSIAFGATVMTTFAGSALAEQGGGVTGRTLDMQTNQGNTTETFYRSYDDATEMGVRLSHRYSEQMIVYGDFVKADVDVIGKGDGFGAGIFYFLPDKLDGYDVAARASYHTQDVSASGSDLQIGGLTVNSATTGLKATSLSAELLVSPLQPIQPNGLTWYAGIGVAKIDTDLSVSSGNINVSVEGLTGKQSSTEVIGSAGLVLPTSFGSAFAAIDYEDGAAYAIGARYQF